MSSSRKAERVKKKLDAVRAEEHMDEEQHDEKVMSRRCEENEESGYKSCIVRVCQHACVCDG